MYEAPRDSDLSPLQKHPRLSARIRGCVLGLACGDALGAPLEWQNPSQVPPPTDLLPSATHNTPAGTWTDDTSLFLCLTASLLCQGGFDAKDQMTRYEAWLHHGYLSAMDQAFGSGRTTRRAIAQFTRSGNPYSGSSELRDSGNGSLSRSSAIALYYANDPERALHYAAESSRTTHASPLCLDACRYFTALLLGALAGTPHDTLLQARYDPFPGCWKSPLHPEIEAVAQGSFRLRSPPDIRGTGYVVQSLEAALWAVHEAKSFQDACQRAVHLYEDADSTGALAGALAGTLWGVEAIPSRWTETLRHTNGLLRFADALTEHQSQATQTHLR